MSVRVHLRPRVPSPTEAFDAATALGRTLRDQSDATSVEVTVNTNRSRLLSWRWSGGCLKLSVHVGLLDRISDVSAAVMERDANALMRIRLAGVGTRGPSTSGTGTTHDLDALRERELSHVRRLNPSFDGRDIPLGWARWPNRAPSRQLQLGVCSGTPPAIRIHPVLDHRSVPEWFVGFVIFHELLHAAFPPRPGRARIQIHTKAFREAERTHPRYADSLLWEEAHFKDLLVRVASEVGRLGSQRGR